MPEDEKPAEEETAQVPPNAPQPGQAGGQWPPGAGDTPAPDEPEKAPPGPAKGPGGEG